MTVTVTARARAETEANEGCRVGQDQVGDFLGLGLGTGGGLG